MLKKIVIPVAGLGTRFLPFTKSIPKEMLPVVDAPSILLLVEEAYRAGFSDIVLVQGRGKSAIEDFFDVSYELEHTLEQKNKTSLLDRVLDLRGKINIISVRQQRAMGLGHAILTARPVIGNEPFAVMLGDEIMDSSNELIRLRELFESTGMSSVSVMEVSPEQVHKYGVIKIEEDCKTHFKVKDLIEKPSKQVAPSLFALPGRYVFTSKIFDYIETLAPGAGGEIQLTDAMIKLAQNEGLLAVQTQSKRHDLGDKFGFIQANIDYGLKDPEVGPRLKDYLKSLLQQL